MVMTVLMDEIVDKIKIATVEAVDEGEPRSMPVAEADNSFRLERNNTGSQQPEHIMALGPRKLDGLPGTSNAFNLSPIGRFHSSWLAIFSIDQCRADGDGIMVALDGDDWWMASPLPLPILSPTRPDG